MEDGIFFPFLEQHVILPDSLWEAPHGISVINGYVALQIIWNSGEILLGWQKKWGSVPHFGESRYLKWRPPPSGVHTTGVHTYFMSVAHLDRADQEDIDHLSAGVLINLSLWRWLNSAWKTCLQRRQLHPTPGTSESWQRASIMSGKHADEGFPGNSCSDLKLLKLVTPTWEAGHLPMWVGRGAGGRVGIWMAPCLDPSNCQSGFAVFCGRPASLGTLWQLRHGRF